MVSPHSFIMVYMYVCVWGVCAYVFVCVPVCVYVCARPREYVFIHNLKETTAYQSDIF